MTHVFRHPKFYRIPRDKEEARAKLKVPSSDSDQAISKRQPTGESERASWSGPQASSSKQQAIEESVPYTDIIEASSSKPQASSTKFVKPQAASIKPQATSVKLQATSVKLQDS